MKPEKIPLSTLAKMEKGELQMTEEGQQQLAQWSERIRSAMPSSDALQAWSKQQANYFDTIKRSFITVPKSFQSFHNTLTFLPSIGTGKTGFDLESMGLYPFVTPKFGIDISKIAEQILPFTESIKEVRERLTEVEKTALEVYENEKELYYKEFGIRMPYAEFLDWFLRKHNDMPIWEAFDSITYSSIAGNYGQFIAETRFKRIINHNVHFELQSKTMLTALPAPQQSVDEPESYLIPSEYKKTFQIDYYSDLVNEKFGYNWGGTPFYNSLILSIVNNSAISVQQRLSGSNYSEYKLIDVIIDGEEFYKDYVEGFKEGIAFFEKEYPSSAAYGSFANDYASNLHKHYKHGPDNIGIGWEWEAKAHPRILTHVLLRDFGYYAGLCFSIDVLAERHPHLSDVLYKCKNADNETNIETPDKSQIPETLFDAWKEKPDKDNKKPYYEEVIQSLIKGNYLKKTQGKLQWVKKGSYKSYCAGFARTCIDQDWIEHYSAPKLKTMLNTSFDTNIQSSTSLKPDSLYSLDEKYLKPFQNMCKNSK